MKAILVIDMPKDCWDCPLHRNSWDEDNEEIMICRGTYIESHYGEIPDWCPLISMPEKKANTSDTIQDYDYETAFNDGYNKCIDEISREKDELNY